MSDDVIYRQAAIDALDRIFDQCEEIEAHLPKGDPDRTGYKMYPDYMTAWKYLHQLSSAEPELDEWCTDCKEYDQERHCCPRWNRVIRNTLKDAERKPGRWIPVYKDKPKAGERVLLCLDNDEVVIGWWSDEYNKFDWWDDSVEFYDGVIAWMPLPKAYKAESEDKE